jgi:hypothetical protein
MRGNLSERAIISVPEVLQGLERQARIGGFKSLISFVD